MSSISKIKELSVADLSKIIQSCNSQRGVLIHLGIAHNNGQAKKYLTAFIERHLIDITHFHHGRPLHLRYTKDFVETLAKSNVSWTGLMTGLGIRFVGSNILTVKKLITYYGIDVSHFDISKALSIASHSRKTCKEILCENSMVNRCTLKAFIRRHSLLKYECKQCKLGDEWQNKKIVLNIEHQNGINDDNRLENLCYLCPNCHSQTSTFAGRNQTGKLRIDTSSK